MSHSGSIVAPAVVPLRTFVCSPANVGFGAAWVHVAGDLDIATAPQLDRTLREAELQTRLVVLDLREVPFMDCSGVHTIVDASVRAREVGRRLLLLRGPPDVDRMFALNGSSHEVETCASALAVPVVAGLAHHGDDLFHSRRVRRIDPPLVAGRASGVVAGHGRRRTAPTGGTEHC